MLHQPPLPSIHITYHDNINIHSIQDTTSTIGSSTPCQMEMSSCRWRGNPCDAVHHKDFLFFFWVCETEMVGVRWKIWKRDAVNWQEGKWNQNSGYTHATITAQHKYYNIPIYLVFKSTNWLDIQYSFGCHSILHIYIFLLQRKCDR